MKITEDELNTAYCKANQFKTDGYPTRNYVEVELERNPLTDSKYFNKGEKFSTSIKLKFEVDNSLGKKGSYVLTSNVDIVHEN